jgi:LuxR family maltose regulon positive regulatory protein
VLLGIAEQIDGREEVADGWFDQAAAQAPDLGAPAAGALALAARALIAFRGQRWVDAEILSERSLAAVKQGHLEDYPTSALTFAASARVALHRGDVNQARRRAADAATLSTSLTHALPHLAVLTRFELAHVAIALANVDEAERVLDEATTLLSAAPGFGALWDAADRLRGSLDDARANASGVASLTPAEIRLIPLLSTQLSFPEIAQEMFVSPHTVKHQARSIYRKLQVTSRTAAIRQCRDIGLLPREQGAPVRRQH